MAINLDAIKGRLNKLQTTSKKADRLWKPTPGKAQIRIVPYKFNKEYPFIELYFHYNINNKTYLSPISFGRPDPIVEFAEKLKRMGDKEDWKAANKMMPKLRTFVPVLVRGEESEGIRFWGFGKTVYQDILGYMADPDYGDISDPDNGRDITVEYVSAEDAGTSYPVTTLRVKPKESKLSDDKKQMEHFLESQVEITDIYQELSYDELKGVLESWLNPAEGEETADDDEESVSEEVLSEDGEEDLPAKKPVKAEKTESSKSDKKPAPEKPKAAKPKEETVDKAKLNEVAAAFDDLFGEK